MVQVHGLLVDIRFKCVISIWERRVYGRIVFGQFYSPLDSICGRFPKREKRGKGFGEREQDWAAAAEKGLGDVKREKMNART